MKFTPIAARSPAAFSFSLPSDLQQAVKRAQQNWDATSKTDRLWNKDASLWTRNDEASWLGWLGIVDQQLDGISKFKSLAAQVHEDGFKQMVVLGMGGSILAPRVFSRTFGPDAGGPDAERPELLVLNSTDPLQIRSLRARIDPLRTLFCVSSRSGVTLEPNMFLQYFYHETNKVVGAATGHHFIAVTDPDSKLEGIAKELGFRHVYHGLPSIGDRYSALSDFGLVPHTAAGYDTETLLRRAQQMVQQCKSSNAAANPGVTLGVILATAVTKFDRDKVTLLCSPAIHELGAWLEQLLAEATGKQGRGFIPVDREPFAPTHDYGKDRLFVYVKLSSDNDTGVEDHLNALEHAGQPVVRMVLNDRYDLGQAFFQWEVATAVAAAVIGINPFDQPDAEPSKMVTRELTAEFEKTGSLPSETPLLEQDGIQLFADARNAEALGGSGANTLGAVIRQHLDRINPGDYFGLLAYLPMFPELEEKLQQIRRQVLEAKQVATALGFGPRFLHSAKGADARRPTVEELAQTSVGALDTATVVREFLESTGQPYKGGPNSGVFLQITCDQADDLAIPRQKYTFGMVTAAQARGDFQVMADRRLRLLRVHLGPDVAKGLDRLRNFVSAAVAH